MNTEYHEWDPVFFDEIVLRMDTSLFLDERKTSFSDNEMTVKWMDSHYGP